MSLSDDEEENRRFERKLRFWLIIFCVFILIGLRKLVKKYKR